MVPMKSSEDQRRRAKEWAAANPEKYRSYQTAWRARNKDKAQAYNKEWRAKNQEKIKSCRAKKDHKTIHRTRYANPEYVEKCKRRAKAWRKANPDRYNEAMRNWKVANPERAKAIEIAGMMNRRSRNLAVGKAKSSDVKIVRARRKCQACGVIHSRMEVDHIIALSQGGTNHLSNLQLLCRPCNRSKSWKDPIAWAQENGRLL